MSSYYHVKFFEVRDAATFIPMVGILLSRYSGSSIENWLMGRAGYGDPLILFGALDGGQFYYDYFDWNDRTRHTAHKYVYENWGDLKSGEVIDVEFILGERAKKKVSEKCEEEALAKRR